MPLLCDRRPSSALRDRIGIVSGTGAVVCLAIMIARWPQPPAIQRCPSEQQLFDDLSLFDASLPSQPHLDVPSTLAHIPSPQSTTSTPATLTSRSGQLDVTPELLHPVLATPIDQRPRERQPHFIQPVAHKQTPNGNSVWLSGSIEPDHDSSKTTATTAPVTLVFPHELRPH